MAANAARAFGAEDLVQAHKVGAACVSPDGRQIVYVQRQWRCDTKKTSSDLFLLQLPVDGGPAPLPIQLTLSSGDDSTVPSAGDGVAIPPSASPEPMGTMRTIT